jgi:pimeloyl-ACP methyl ester carboxylesterase
MTAVSCHESLAWLHPWAMPLIAANGKEGDMTATTGLSYGTAPNQVISADNGIDYAYREVGAVAIPLVLLQHFRGNLENWDFQLVDALASQRRVVAFDNVGVGGTTGTTPNTIAQMARDAIAFIATLDTPQVDLLGFSIGSFVAQEIALNRPDLVRRLVLASSAPRGGAGMHGWAPEVIKAVGQPQPDPKGYLDVFFTHLQVCKRARRLWVASTDAPPTSTHRPHGRPGWRSMTRCASGASPIMLRCNASVRSVIRCSSPTGTATR